MILKGNDIKSNFWVSASHLSLSCALLDLIQKVWYIDNKKHVFAVLHCIGLVWALMTPEKDLSSITTFLWRYVILHYIHFHLDGRDCLLIDAALVPNPEVNLDQRQWRRDKYFWRMKEYVLQGKPKWLRRN